MPIAPSRSACRALLVLATAGATLLAVPASSGAASFSCDASAFRAQLLTVPAIEPVTANRANATCVNQVAGGGGLSAGLISGGLVFATTNVPDASHAKAQGGIADLNVASGPLSAIPLPTQLAAAALPPVTVPLNPALQTLLGLGTSSISVNIRPAVQALLPSSGLPSNLLGVHLGQATATASCVGGTPKLEGSSNVAGLTVLGQTLPTDAAITQALTVIGPQSIAPSKLDLSKVVLPPGLSLTDPATGTLLQAALQNALNALPTISLPASLVQVSVLPGEQIVTSDSLTQRALHVGVSLVGQPLADIVLAEARMAHSAVRCPAAGGAATSGAAAEALRCTHRKIVLIDVLDRGNHVTLLGAADRSLVGKRVNVVFDPTHRVVARPVVEPNGLFHARARVPSRSIRYTDAARYVAKAGREHSLHLKLHRRMVVSRIRSSHRRIRITGYLTRPLTNPPSVIVVTRRLNCRSSKVVTRVRPRRNGRWSALVLAPPRGDAAVYRATTWVLHAGTRIRNRTYTLPRVVEIKR